MPTKPRSKTRPRPASVRARARTHLAAGKSPHTAGRPAKPGARSRPGIRPAAAPYYSAGKLPPAPGGKGLRLVTWNINSVRLRLKLLGRLVRLANPDIICLQETKCPDDQFPAAAIAKLGYPHQVIHGMKGYNGVAILSRHPLMAPQKPSWCDRDDSRHVAAEIPGGIELHNVYVPAGGDIPDPAVNPKFAHKLQFLGEQAAWWAAQKRDHARRIMVGDLNVAPLENDVWSHRQLLDVVSHTPVEVELLGRLVSAHDWVDVARAFVPASEKLYTWWSYRNRDWKVSDRGRRLDHIWVTPALKAGLRAIHVLSGARDWPNPSDHVPVAVDLLLPGASDK
jgi:exodeoxyribonuclease-3